MPSSSAAPSDFGTAARFSPAPAAASNWTIRAAGRRVHYAAPRVPSASPGSLAARRRSRSARIAARSAFTSTPMSRATTAHRTGRRFARVGHVTHALTMRQAGSGSIRTAADFAVSRES